MAIVSIAGITSGAARGGSTDGPNFEAPENLAAAFRSVLDAMASPGAPQRLPVAPAAIPPLSPAAAMAMKVLADADAPVWLGRSRSGPEIDRYVRFYVNAAPVADPARAAFLCGTWDELAALHDGAAPSIGTPERPDLSATYLVEVAGFDQGPSAELRGPGLKDPRRLAVEGVDERFWPFVAANAAQFPLGVDLILCAGDQLVGLPRSSVPTLKTGADQEREG